MECSLPPYKPRQPMAIPKLSARMRKSLRRFTIFGRHVTTFPTTQPACARLRIQFKGVKRQRQVKALQAIVKRSILDQQQHFRDLHSQLRMLVANVKPSLGTSKTANETLSDYSRENHRKRDYDTFISNG
ncbi:hypothetical protein FA15DRAFT_667526 [Coprinopsis marcescibilis]|uniref:Uncharacterized protein n=1 Tax=Coprinopsis marcescibilis TaxID=230819 RepID=A0A5C3L2L5_COPMA|nr:hypothetical protein FA15DRAFT_667526 [Coprinopsis marcescibilis]